MRWNEDERCTMYFERSSWGQGSMGSPGSSVDTSVVWGEVGRRLRQLVVTKPAEPRLKYSTSVLKPIANVGCSNEVGVNGETEW